MKIGKPGTSYLPALMVLAWLVPLAATQSHYAGWIEEIHGRTYWRPSTNGKKVRLDQKKDQYRRLHVGEAVHCKHGATLQLRIYGKLQPITEKSGWYQIPEGKEAPDIPYGLPGGRQASVEPGDAFVAQAMMNGYGEKLRWRTSPAALASGQLTEHAAEYFGASPIILSPVDGGYVLSDQVVFRWHLNSGFRVLTLAIQDEKGKLLWQEEVDGAAGELASESARQALRKYRDEEGSAQLRFVLIGDTGLEESVKFSVLSAEEELVLTNALAQWDGQQPVLRYVGRALEFSQRGMTFEAAQEYQAARASAPDSLALSDATIGAYHQAGALRVPRRGAVPAAAPANPPK